MFCTLGFCYFVLLTAGSCLLVEPHFKPSPSASYATLVPDHYTSLATTELEDGGVGVGGGGVKASPSYQKEPLVIVAVDITPLPLTIRSPPSSPSKNQHHSSKNLLESSPSKNQRSFQPDSPLALPTVKEVGPWTMLRSPLSWHVAACFITTTIGGVA